MAAKTTKKKIESKVVKKKEWIDPAPTVKKKSLS